MVLFVPGLAFHSIGIPRMAGSASSFKDLKTFISPKIEWAKQDIQKVEKNRVDLVISRPPRRSYFP